MGAVQGLSYYSFVPTMSSPYLIGLMNPKTGDVWGSLEWELSLDPAFTSILCNCNYSTYTGDAVCSTNATDYPAVSLEVGRRYFLRVRNWSNASDNAYTVTVKPFNAAIGCNAGGSCESFEASLPNFNWYPSWSNAPWALSAEESGTGTHSLKAGAIPPPRKKSPQPSYTSCFDYSATDAKWIAFSLKKNVDPTGTDWLELYIDGSLYNGGGWGAWNRWDATSTPWTRYFTRIISAGSHNYSWCYTGHSTGTTDALWIDDIELGY